MTLDSANARINNMWERLAIGLISFVLTALVMMYQGQRSDFKELETRVLSLQVDKVSKEDLRDVEMRINKNFDARIGELISRSASDKADILARIDLLIKTTNGK